VNHYVRVRGTDGKGELIEDFMNHMLKTERAQSYHDVQFNLSTVQGVEIDERAQQSYPTSDDEFETLLQGFPNYVRLDPYSEDLVEEFNKIVNA
jgi:L-arabinose isomerase